MRSHELEHSPCQSTFHGYLVRMRLMLVVMLLAGCNRQGEGRVLNQQRGFVQFLAHVLARDVQFDDERGIQESFSKVEIFPGLESAGLYRLDGVLVSGWRSSLLPNKVEKVSELKATSQNKHLVITNPVFHRADSRVLGFVSVSFLQ